MGACRHVVCIQCGMELRGTEARALTVVVDTQERSYPACRDTLGCRDLWWGELAYHLDLSLT